MRTAGPITARDIERDIEQSLQRELLFLEMELDKKRLALEVEVQRSRIEAEQSGRVQDGQLCATPYGVDIVRSRAAPQCQALDSALPCLVCAV